MNRKLKIFAEVIYNDNQIDNKLLSDRDFTVGDVNTIVDCVNKTIEEISRNYIAIESAAAFFNIIYSIRSFTIYVTGVNDEVVETLTVNDLEEVTKITDMVLALCR